MDTQVLPDPVPPSNPSKQALAGETRTDFAGRQVRVWPPAKARRGLRWLAYPALTVLAFFTLITWLAFQHAARDIHRPGQSTPGTLTWLAVGVLCLWPMLMAFKDRDPAKTAILMVPSLLGWVYALRLIITDDPLRAWVGKHDSLAGLLTLWPILFAAFLALTWLRHRTEGSGVRYAGSLPVADILARQTWGRPGLGLQGAEVFGETAEIGSAGERVTATALGNLLAEVPEARIFHGLRFPGSEVADVDHAVAIGDCLFIIDTKRWKPGTYSWGEWGQVLRDGREFTGGTVHMDEVVTRFKDHFAQFSPQTLVYSYILILPDLETGQASQAIGDLWNGNVSLRTSPEAVVESMLGMADYPITAEEAKVRKQDRLIGGRYLNLRTVDEMYDRLIDRA